MAIIIFFFPIFLPEISPFGRRGASCPGVETFLRAQLAAGAMRTGRGTRGNPLSPGHRPLLSAPLAQATAAETLPFHHSAAPQPHLLLLPGERLLCSRPSRALPGSRGAPTAAPRPSRPPVGDLRGGRREGSLRGVVHHQGLEKCQAKDQQPASSHLPDRRSIPPHTHPNLLLLLFPKSARR